LGKTSPRGYPKKNDSFKNQRIKFIEYLLKHCNDETKDVRFLVNFKSEVELYFNFTKTFDFTDYDDKIWLRFIHEPKTRREKVVVYSQMHNIPSIRNFIKE